MESKIIDGVVIRLVPTTDNLWVSECARVYKDDMELLGTRRADGYHTTKHGILGLSTQRHRLVAMAWKVLPRNYLELQVNHLNNTPGDDWNDNLEWATPKRNTEHSVNQCRMGNRKIYYKLGLAGDINFALSTRKLESELGLEGVGISSVLRKVPVYLSENGYLIGYSRDRLASKNAYTPREIRMNGTVELVDASSNVLSSASSVRTLSPDGTGLSKNQLVYKFSCNGSRVTDEYSILFKLEGVQYSLSESEVRTRVPPEPIRVYDILSGTEEMYGTITEVGEVLGMDGSIITRRLQTNNLRALTPHHRVTRDHSIVFSDEINFTDLISLCRIELMDGLGAVLISEKSIHEYSFNAEYLGIHTQSTITFNFKVHIRRAVDAGYIFRFIICNTDVTDKVLSLCQMN